MAATANRAPATVWRPRKRLWGLFAAFVAGSVVLGAISDWREDHALLINTTESLPNWAFLIHRNKLPARGDYVFFDPPASELVRAHFGPKPQMFGKIVYGMPGDIVRHWHLAVTVNGRIVAYTKPRTKSGEPLAIGPSGVIPAGCYYVGTPHKDGFDSRYAAIGFACQRQIVGTGEAIL
ncbi:MULTISPECIES: S26 family signal peptidase [Sphingomonas]|jgi:conjugal transfer pilin signal peptidase TrbI|uniref:S26 family signal peptidase n=1 Tax=Sphingomonas sanguinis TaxID=33051 RepID=A0A7Y7QYL4_9SPHN|nr:MULTISPECIES: S26 family signal peptidase [Sphingomonas]KKI19730.1 type VI secretion protein [Sphingomonas sp. Ag1]MBZ6383851.1 S26 family signal peptidase [Sphingomonas sanguinis]NNG54270.1 type VI secretion protein [Sphingomonas sanguinis]NVP33142.1 S26 family signal peptidase [Sphingomonas sanguinis]